MEYATVQTHVQILSQVPGRMADRSAGGNRGDDTRSAAVFLIGNRSTEAESVFAFGLEDSVGLQERAS